MEQERKMDGNKSDTGYNGNGFKRDEQEKPAQEPACRQARPELIQQGEFLTDKKAMERIVDEELAKIVGEQLLPYNLYLRNSAKTLGLCLSGLILSIGGMAIAFKFIRLLAEPLFIFIFVISVFGIAGFSTVLGRLGFEDNFSIHPLYKLHRVKKIFEQFSEELRNDTLNGKVEIKNLQQAFNLKVFELGQKKEQEEADRKKQLEKIKKDDEAKTALIAQAKNSKL